MLSLDPPPSAPSRRLPNEIIHLIVEAVVPENLKAIALPASDPVTKTLLALARTSSVTYAPALRLLYSHCLYVDSFARLASITTALQLADKFENTPAQITRYNLRIRPRQSVRLELLSCVTSMYLAPFRQRKIGNYQGQLNRMCSLLRMVAPKLKRLVLSVPEWCMEEADGDINFPLIHTTLVQLTSLEIFCSIRDSLWMVTEDGEMNGPEKLAWTRWPNLRILGLSGAYPDGDTWKLWASLDKLERLILTHCDGVGEDDYKLMYGEGQSGKSLELVLVDYIGRRMGLQYWDDERKGAYTKEQNLLNIRQVTVPGSDTGDSTHKCLEWVTESFLRGDEKFETE